MADVPRIANIYERRVGKASQSDQCLELILQIAGEGTGEGRVGQDAMLVFPDAGSAYPARGLTIGAIRPVIRIGQLL